MENTVIICKGMIGIGWMIGEALNDALVVATIVHIKDDLVVCCVVGKLDHMHNAGRS